LEFVSLKATDATGIKRTVCTGSYTGRWKEHFVRLRLRAPGNGCF